MVLIFADHYLPGFKFGGPIKSIANFVENFSDDFEFRIVTRDRDFGDTLRYPSVTPGKWMRAGRGHALYLDPSEQTLRRIALIMQETTHDVVYLNSFFSPRFTILPLLAQWLGMAPRQQVIMSPRGELSAGALQLKLFKKRAYVLAAKACGIYDHAIWKASTDFEANDIRAVFGPKTRVVVASDLPHFQQVKPPNPQRKSGQPLRVIFLSRISPMKNLSFALQVLAQVRVPVDFSIIGPVSDQAYWTECQNLMAAIPNHININYLGAVSPANVQNCIAENDLFFLPTLGENFGHVIIEALAAGTPTLISDRTPWQDLALARCGWTASLENPYFFVAQIEALYSESPQKLNARRKAAFLYAQSYMQKNMLGKKIINLFKNFL